MRFRNPIFILLAALILSSCRESQNKGSNSTGRGSEIIVVGHKPVWDGPVGDAIRRVLTCNMPGLPEAEPEFTLIFIPEKNFSKFLQTHRNVLIIDIGPGYKTSKVETISNEWSHPQRVIKVKAGSDTALINIFTRHSEAIRELFNQNERARFTAQNAFSQNLVVEKLLAEEFGIKMVIAKDFYLAKKMSDFVWLRSGTTANSLDLMIYTLSL